MARLQHVTVTVPSEEKLPEVEEFYRHLGGVPLVRPEMLAADTPGAWLGFEGGTQVHLIVGNADPGPAHFALDVGDAYHRVLEELEEAGISRRDARQSWGARRCFVTDPAGNLVELFERPPPWVPAEPGVSPG